LAQAEKERDGALGEAARLREDLSIYQTPLGELKKTIRGLELPLSILPLAVVALFLGVVAFFVIGLLGARRNAALQQGLERLGAALQQGLQARPPRSGGRDAGAMTHLEGSGARALAAPSAGLPQSGASRAEVVAILEEICASPHAALTGLEALSRRGEIAAMDTLLHCLPTVLRARALASGDVQGSRRGEMARASVDWNSALGDAIRLQLFLAEEFGPRLLALTGFLTGPGLRRDEIALRAAIERRDDIGLRRALFVLPRGVAVAALADLDGEDASWLLSHLLDVERSPAEAARDVETARGQERYDAIAPLAARILEDVPQLAARLRTGAPDTQGGDLAVLRRRLDDATVGIADLLALDAASLREIILPLGDEDVADLCHAVEAREREILAGVLGPVRAESVIALFERAGSSRLQARESRRRGRELAKVLVGRWAPLVEEETGRRQSKGGDGDANGEGGGSALPMAS
jgi:hypothetical protein